MDIPEQTPPFNSELVTNIMKGYEDLGLMSGSRMAAAVGVIVLTPHIREYLRQNDPMALRQCEQALGGRS